MKVFRFLKDKWFYISLIIMVLVVVAVFEITFLGQARFTRHGKEFSLPNMIGMNYDEAAKLYKRDLTFILVDSIYVKDFPEGAVYQQNPRPGSMVKKGRNVYIIRTSIAPEVVSMPNLRNLSLRQAIVSLNIAGLQVDKLVFVEYFARNAVIEQKIGNKVIEPKEDVVKGTAITLVVGLGTGNKNTNLPNLVGVGMENAKEILHKASLNLGTEIFVDDADPEHLFVCRMSPNYSLNAMVPLGSQVDVWYRSDENFDLEWYKNEQYRRDSIAEAWRLKRYSPEKIKHFVDSVNKMLRNELFPVDDEFLEFEFSDDNDDNTEDDNNENPSYFYDE